MKKFITCFLILMLAMFVGCANSSTGTESDDTGNPVNVETETEGMGELLSASYVEMMKSGKYLLKYRATIEFEGQSAQLEATAAVAGEDSAFISKVGGIESKMIFKEDKVYMIDHANKSILIWSSGAEDEDDGTIDTEGITYIGKGIEDGLDYEEYSTEDGSIKYYFDGKKLVKMIVVTENETMLMEILEMSDKVPDSMFEIPSDYQTVSM
ncbi:MAG: hypothetical protein PHG06_17880 [Parabacteroides sp.]|nr:hypothetical protein [Parabacteroides sp.]